MYILSNVQKKVFAMGNYENLKNQRRNKLIYFFKKGMLLKSILLSANIKL